MESPIDGLVTKRNVEEGETAMIGTMNNAGTVLLTIADMSVIETEIEVDETDVPHVQVGQPAKIEIDAFPDHTFPGKVTEVGNSPIPRRERAPPGRATNFKVVVQIEGEVPDVRPGFTCTATITTATRTEGARRADSGHDCPRAGRGRSRARSCRPKRRRRPRRRPTPVRCRRPSSSPVRPRKEIEGVFVVAGRPRDVRAGQDRHRGREILRGPRRAEGRRRGHHGALRLGSHAQGRRRCEGLDGAGGASAGAPNGN